MSVKLLTEHHLEFLSLKVAAQVRLSLHLSKCYIVGNHMSRLAEHHLEFISLKVAAQARLSLHLSKCHIVGNHMSRLNYLSRVIRNPAFCKESMQNYPAC